MSSTSACGVLFWLAILEIAFLHFLVKCDLKDLSDLIMSHPRERMVHWCIWVMRERWPLSCLVCEVTMNIYLCSKQIKKERKKERKGIEKKHTHTNLTFWEQAFFLHALSPPARSTTTGGLCTFFLPRDACHALLACATHQLPGSTLTNNVSGRVEVDRSRESMLPTPLSPPSAVPNRSSSWTLPKDSS